MFWFVALAPDGSHHYAVITSLLKSKMGKKNLTTIKLHGTQLN